MLGGKPVKYRYFISYAFQNGIGRCYVERSTKIKSIEDIESIEKSIIKNGQLNEVSIINYILMEE